MATSHPGTSHTSRLFYISDRKTGTRFLVDTGAEVSVIPPTKAEKLHPSSKFHLQAVNRSSITTYGERSMTLNILGLRRTCKWIFIIVDIATPIIGADFLRHFSLLVNICNQRLTDSTTSLSVRNITSTMASISPMFVAPNRQAECQSILDKFPDITRPVYKDTEIKHNVTHHIETRGPPVSARPHRLAPDRYNITKAEFDHMGLLLVFGKFPVVLMVVFGMSVVVLLLSCGIFIVSLLSSLASLLWVCLFSRLLSGADFVARSGMIFPW